MTSFSILDNIVKRKQEKFKLSFEYFKNIMEIGAFAPKEQMLHFPSYFQIYISKASKGIIMKYISSVFF